MVKKAFICTLTDCEKSFASQSKLNDHISTHTKTPKYSCTECNKSYYRKYHLKRHSIVHTKESRYKCEKCGTTKYEKYRYIRHINQCGVKYPCLICGRVFSQNVNFRMHKCKETKTDTKSLITKNDEQNISKNKEDMKNEDCDKIQNEKLQTNSAENSNNTIKNNKTKKIKSGVNDASSENLFVCLHCEKVYTTINLLNTHNRAKHDFTVKNICDCGKMYVYKQSLIKHKKKCKLQQTKAAT